MFTWGSPVLASLPPTKQAAPLRTSTDLLNLPCPSTLAPCFREPTRFLAWWLPLAVPNAGTSGVPSPRPASGYVVPDAAECARSSSTKPEPRCSASLSNETSLIMVSRDPALAEEMGWSASVSRRDCRCDEGACLSRASAGSVWPRRPLSVARCCCCFSCCSCWCCRLSLRLPSRTSGLSAPRCGNRDRTTKTNRKRLHLIPEHSCLPNESCGQFTVLPHVCFPTNTSI